jgi:hypothetical protein
VIAARASERVRGGLGEVPVSPRDVSAAWLTRVLCAATPGARVSSVARLEGSTGTTTRQALVLTYDGLPGPAELPTRLFVKCTSTAAQRLMLGLGGLIDGEPGFYNHIRPGLEIEAPAGYFGAVDPRAWRSIVVIEDVVATRGASFWEPGAPVARTELEELLSSVAAWHGGLWEDERLRRWGWLKTPAEQMAVIDALIGIADRRSIGFERARAVIPAALHRRQPDLFEGMRRSMTAAADRPHTYLHGDLHIANTYRTRDGRWGVADWQVGLRGSWAYDYAYLVTTALEVEDRRACERELLDFYLERLASCGGPAIARARAWVAYRQATLYPYFAWLYTIGRSRLQPQFQPDEVSLTMIRRISAAIEDLDSLGAVGL